VNLLLDTHIWLWNELGSPNLLPRCRALLADPSNQLWLSPISAWELVLLAEKHRIRFDCDIGSWIQRFGGPDRYREAPVEFGVVQASLHVRLPHHDPADRLLAATALFNRFTLLTADQALLSGSGFPVLPNQ